MTTALPTTKKTVYAIQKGPNDFIGTDGKTANMVKAWTWDEARYPKKHLENMPHHWFYVAPGEDFTKWKVVIIEHEICFGTLVGISVMDLP